MHDMAGIFHAPHIPAPTRVILCSLYKFAEACGGCCQFTLSTLLDDTITLQPEKTPQDVLSLFP